MRYKFLIEAGLGTAIRETHETTNNCANQHVQYIDRGYKFCPHCGKPISILINCPTCGHRFASQKSFVFHLHRQHRKPHQCPNCGKDGRLINECPFFSKATTPRVQYFMLRERSLWWHCLTCNAVFLWQDGRVAYSTFLKRYDPQPKDWPKRYHEHEK